MARRKAVWCRTNTTRSAAAGVASGVELLADLETNLGRTFSDVTIVRLILKYYAQMNGPTFAMDGGIGVFIGGRSQTASTFPKPTTPADYNADWYVWDLLQRQAIGRETSAATYESEVVYREYDIRTARKLRASDTAWFVISNISNTLSVRAVIQMVVLL